MKHYQQIIYFFCEIVKCSIMNFIFSNSNIVPQLLDCSIPSMKKIQGVFLVCLVALIMATQSTNKQATVPIPEELFCKLSICMQRLQKILHTYRTPYENKYEIWKRTELTKRYLHELNVIFQKHNNIIIGNQNKLNGNKNVIVGNYNNIQGSNNWVFISNFQGKIDGDLLIALWRVEIDKSRQILIDPSKAISFIDESKNVQTSNKYYKKNRQVCKWDKWAEPTQKHYKAWNKYYGYEEYVSNWNTKLGSFIKDIFGYSKTRGSQGGYGNVYPDNGKNDDDSSSNSNKKRLRRQSDSDSSSDSSKNKKEKDSKDSSSKKSKDSDSDSSKDKKYAQKYTYYKKKWSSKNQKDKDSKDSSSKNSKDSDSGSSKDKQKKQKDSSSKNSKDFDSSSKKQKDNKDSSSSKSSKQTSKVTTTHNTGYGAHTIKDTLILNKKSGQVNSYNYKW